MMDLNLVQNYTYMQQEKLATQVGIKVLKMANDFNNQIVSELIQKLANVNLNNNPSNTGQLLDIRA